MVNKVFTHLLVKGKYFIYPLLVKGKWNQSLKQDDDILVEVSSRCLSTQL